MRCKDCDYPLWNLKTRQCPECGRGFLPDEFEFTINSVQFCCVHCGQCYYGTDEKGHLLPREFHCVTCKRWVTMNEMVLRPAAGVEEKQTRALVMPWLERRPLLEARGAGGEVSGRRGFFSAWFGTIGKAMVTPQDLMLATPERSSLWSAFWFALLTLGAIVMVGAFPMMMCMFGMPLTIMGAPGASSAWAHMQRFGLNFAVTMLVIGACIIAGLMLWTVTTHGMLRMTGGSKFGLGRTFQALCYSSGANVLLATPPCVGLYFGWMWWLISAVLMVRKGQQVHGGRAAAAVLTLPGLLVCVLVGLIALAIYQEQRSMARMQAQMPNAPTVLAMSEQTLAEQLLAHSASTGRWPAHATELLVGANVSAFDFVDSRTLTTPADVRVCNVALEDLEELGRAEQTAVVAAAASALPGGTIAHRVGDFVFTYHGIDRRATYPQLWIVVCSPDPDCNPPLLPNANVSVSTASGFTYQFPASQLSLHIARQNVARAQFGLSPLPDPGTVTHATPATFP